MSVFKHGLLSNRAMLIALPIELALIVAAVYLPGLNSFLGGAPIPVNFNSICLFNINLTYIYKIVDMLGSRCCSWIVHHFTQRSSEVVCSKVPKKHNRSLGYVVKLHLHF